MRINGVERLVLVTAGDSVINDALGKPITFYNLGPNNSQGNPPQYNSQGNKPAINSSKSILRQNFILPFILNFLDINLPEGSENLTKYSFGVLIISLVALLCFINILGYFLSLYILNKYNITNKFPKLKKLKHIMNKLH